MGLFTPKWETNDIKKKDRAIAAVSAVKDKETIFKLISDMTWFRSVHHGFIMPQDHKAHLALYASKKFTEKDDVLRAAKAVCYEGAAAEKREAKQRIEIS